MSNLINWDIFPLELTARDVSKIMKVSLTKVYTLFQRKDFPVFKVNKKHLVILRDKLKKWLEIKEKYESPITWTEKNKEP